MSMPAMSSNVSLFATVLQQDQPIASDVFSMAAMFTCQRGFGGSELAPCYHVSGSE